MSNKSYHGSFFDHFQIIHDRRQEGKIKHRLIDILFIGVCGMICNCDDWEPIEYWANERIEWLRQYIDLEHGVPDFLTIKRVFQVISPKQFEKCFVEWTNEIMKNSGRVVVSIDGKAMCGTASQALDKKAIHIVNAYCKANGLVVGQVKTEEKSNEIKAVPELLDMLCIQGCIVTVDALNTQKDIARKIIKVNKADYTLALKGNHPLLFDEVKLYFSNAMQETSEEAKTYEVYTTKEAGHGRIEKRIYRYSTDISWMEARKEWEGLQGIGMVTRIVEKNGEIRTEDAYHLCSVDKVEEYAMSVRDHWGIESMHWSLDVTFREDAFKTIERNAAENMAMLKRLALNMIKKDHTRYPKKSLKLRRFIASINTDYLDYLFEINFE